MRTLVLTESQYDSLHAILTELHLAKHADLIACSYTDTRRQLIAQIETLSDVITALEIVNDE